MPFELSVTRWNCEVFLCLNKTVNIVFETTAVKTWIDKKQCQFIGWEIPCPLGPIWYQSRIWSSFLPSHCVELLRPYLLIYLAGRSSIGFLYCYQLFKLNKHWKCDCTGLVRTTAWVTVVDVTGVVEFWKSGFFRKSFGFVTFPVNLEFQNAVALSSSLFVCSCCVVPRVCSFQHWSVYHSAETTLHVLTPGERSTGSFPQWHKLCTALCVCQCN